MRLTEKQARELGIETKKPNKYHNEKTVVDGMVFASQKEASYYCELKLRKKAGEIIDFFYQVPFLVHEGYYQVTDQDKKWVKPIYYVADFVVIAGTKVFHTREGSQFTTIIDYKTEIHEVKGYRKNRVWEMKRKMMQAKYPEYELKVI